MAEPITKQQISDMPGRIGCLMGTVWAGALTIYLGCYNISPVAFPDSLPGIILAAIIAAVPLAWMARGLISLIGGLP